MSDLCVRWAGLHGQPGRVRRAFSLAELLVIVIIIGIIAAIAVPRFGKAIGRFRVDGAAQRVALDLSLARNNAVDNSTSQTVTFNLSNHSYQLVGMSSPDNPAAAYIIQLSNEPYRAMITYADFAGSLNLVFDRYGVPAAAGSVRVSVGREVRRIQIGADTGLPTIDIYTGS